MRTVPEEHFDISGGIQGATSWLLRATNEVEDVVNGRFDDEIGVVVRRNGYTQEGDTLQAEKSGLGLHEAKFSTGAKILSAINNSGDTETKIKVYNSADGTQTDLTLPVTLEPNTQVNFADSLDETYVAGIDGDGNVMQMLNIQKDLTVSTTRSLLNAPKARFVEEYGGSLYAMDVEVDGVRYRDRAYRSSPALSVITYVRGEQSDVEAPVTLVDNVPTMTSDTAPFGVAAASSVFPDPSFGAYKVFDDSLIRNGGSWFTASGTTGWVSYDFGASNSKIITYYSVVGVDSDGSTGSDTGTDQARALKSWTLEGSNDGSSWTVLNTQTNVASWTPGERRRYAMTNTTAYRYYRINITANHGGDLLHMNELELLTSGSLTKPLVMAVDSVRYIKPGMELDFYTKSTSTKLFSVQVLAVDKIENTFTFLPFSYTITTSDVNTTSNEITLPATTNFPTGTKVKVDSSATVPAGLTADTVYYAINVSSTKIKLATTLDNALVGNAIDITSTGSGSIRVRLSYSVGDNDEIYLKDRYGELYYLWNTDYPNADKADFLKIPSGAASNSAIVGYGESNSRLFLFTDSTTHKWDQSQLVTVFNDIGCANHETIQSIGDWLIWLDSEQRVMARNDSTGQKEFISRGIRKKFLKYLTTDNHAVASAGKLANVYKLHLGNINGDIIRVCYDFDSNNWTRENHQRQILQQITSDMDGDHKIYFLDDTGKLFKDGVGDLDDEDTIPLMIRYGRNNSGSIMEKDYTGFFIIGQNIAGLGARVYLNGDDKSPIELSVIEISNGYSKAVVGNKAVKGRDINLELSINAKGSAPAIEGYVPFLTAVESRM